MRKHLWVGALAALGVTITASIAGASSHREAPMISNDPAADNTDVWAWVAKGTHDKMWVVASYQPFEEPSGGPNYNKFSDEVLYEIHITRGNTSLADAYTYQFKFSTAPIAVVAPDDKAAALGGGKEFFAQLAGSYAQTYSVTKIDWNSGSPVASEIATGVKVAPPNIGTRTDAVAYKESTGGGYDDAFAATFITNLGTGGAEGKVWAGPRDDGFYVDTGHIFDLANIKPAGTAMDNLAGFNTHSIAIEIPTTKVATGGTVPSGASDANTLGIWASASRRKVTVLRGNGGVQGYGPWVQVSRLGLPLINEAVIGVQDKDKYNRTKPAADVTNFGAYFLNPPIVRDAVAVGIYGTTDPGDVRKYGRTDIIEIINLKNIPAAGAHNIPLTVTGDVLRLDLGVDSGFPNGRPLVDGSGTASNKEPADVTDVELSLLLLNDPSKTSYVLSGVADGVNKNDKNYLTTFPYLALPWRGEDQGHGKNAP